MTTREENRARVRKAKALAEAIRAENARWLQAHRAWNWKWPGGEGLSPNCWQTNSSPKGPPCVYRGSSARVLRKRAARHGNRARWAVTKAVMNA